MDIRSIHTIETAENIHIKVELAGLASRVFAFLIDGALMGLLSALVVGLFALWAYVAKVPEIAKTGIPLGSFAVFFGYHLFQEWLWNGRTVGKFLLHIRVVRNNGQAIGFWESLGRNLMRLLDVYVLGVGLLCMMFNRGEKRFGDFIGGTIVINDAKVTKPTYQLSPASALLDAGEFADVRLTAEEAELLKTYLRRRKQFLKPARLRLVEQLCAYFSQRWHRPVSGEPDLDAALAAYQQAQSTSS
ncbi:RDD family protein [Vampirovibrio chlorellavorus]|uniref:RDD family protein n=1 Tax=Vampirovibrio chlorellavorus TaxID=758823 RepID=UPI0026EEAB97|nr:RDD family protein [Vampirovibrio chlorellavorus]